MNAKTIVRIWLLATLVAASVLLSTADAKKKSRHDSSVIQGLDCSACHTTNAWALSDKAGGTGAFDHAKTGFPLTGEHGKVLCTGCHAPKSKVSRDCASCHKDQHGGRLGLACDSCHNSTSWAETDAMRRHMMSRLPLTGVHSVLECSSCHTRRVDKKFLPVPAACFACHESEYRGDIHPNHQGDPADPGSQPFSRDCSMCHRTGGWSPAFINPAAIGSAAPIAPANHDQSFVISRGPHRGSACATCHPSAQMPKVVECTGCHVHNNAQLRQQHGQWVPTSGSSCLRCHSRGLSR